MGLCAECRGTIFWAYFSYGQLIYLLTLTYLFCLILCYAFYLFLIHGFALLQMLISYTFTTRLQAHKNTTITLLNFVFLSNFILYSHDFPSNLKFYILTHGRTRIPRSHLIMPTFLGPIYIFHHAT